MTAHRNTSHDRKYVGRMATQKDRNEFARAIEHVENIGKGAILTTHDVSDVDGIGSMYALHSYLKAKHPRMPVSMVVQMLPGMTKPLADAVDARIELWRDIPSSDQRPLIILDTNTPVLLKGARGRENQLLMLIDHHEPIEPLVRSTYKIANYNALSAAEIVASVIPSAYIDPKSALALAVGISGDTERLLYADRNCITIFNDLLGIAGLSKARVDHLARDILDGDSVLKVLDDLKNNVVCKFSHKGKSVVIATTDLDIPAKLAEILRDQQVTVSAVLKQTEKNEDPEKDLYKLSIRVTHAEAYENNIHAYWIAHAVAAGHGVMPGSGGGRADKAGAVLRGRLEDICKAISETVKSIIDGTHTIPKSLGSAPDRNDSV